MFFRPSGGARCLRGLGGVALGRTLALVLGTALAFASATTTPAAAFLRIKEAPGESLDPDHRDWIEITGFESALDRSASGETPLPRTEATRALHLRKAADKSTPILARAVATDQVFDGAELELTRDLDSGRVVFYRVVLKGVRVRSFTAHAQANAPMTEGVELDFEIASWVYTEFSPATGRMLASHQTQWDFVRNTGGSSSTRAGFTVRSVKQPGGKLGIQWTPEPGRRYTLRQSPTPEGPYVMVRSIDPVTTPESRWVELPLGPAFAFFLLEEE